MTKILTANNADPITGLVHAYNGWHFVGTNALDVFIGAKTVHMAGWYWEIKPDPTDLLNLQVMYLWHRVDVPPPNTPPDLIVHDTEWLALIGPFARALTEDDVNTNYTVTDKP